MELDESVEREKLVSEGEDDDPSPLETVAHVPTKPVIPVPQSVIMPTKKNAFPATTTATCTTTAQVVYREPNVVVVNNTMQRSTVASPSTATASSLTAPMSPKSSTGGGGGSTSGGARLSFVNERTGSAHSKTNSTSTDKTIKPRKMPRDPDISSSPSPTPTSHPLALPQQPTSSGSSSSTVLPPRPPPPSSLSHSNKHSNSKAGLRFSDRALKHHSFLLSEVPDVRHMEQALLGLLDDFHSGKLRAFGSGTMDQMTNIREQQERLAKLHFELGGAVHNMMMSSDEDSTNSSSAAAGNESETIAQENMTRLVKQLEQLSVSIEGLHSDT